MPYILMDQWEEWAKKDLEVEDADPFERSGEEDKEENGIWDDVGEEKDSDETESEDDED